MRRLTAVLLFASSVAFARDVPVADLAALRAAIAVAQPGDVIIVANGSYTSSVDISCTANGTAQQPIVVKAATPLGVTIESSSTEGFKVSGQHWHFEGLVVRGTCASDDNCEHAFHVSGDADGFTLRGNRLVDFNAQLKANAGQVSGVWQTPDDCLIEGNDLYDTRARDTGNPTTKLNIDTGEDWVVRGNFIHDFQKGGGDTVSYGAFMKSGSKRGVFERNLVICETSGSHAGGARIGLSFGGGGTGNAFCAPAFDANTACDVEHSDGVLRNNIVVNCSDVAVYLNEATNTKVLHNTFIGTNGVDYRFATSTGLAQGNLLGSVVRARNGGTFTGMQNVTNVTTQTFDGYYLAPLAGDLRLEGDVTALNGTVAALTEVTDDYCGRARPSGMRTVGALEHSLGGCATTFMATQPIGGGGGSMMEDAGVTGGGSGATGGGAGAPGGGTGAMGGGAGATGGGTGAMGGGTGVTGGGSGATGGGGTSEPATGCGCVSADSSALFALLALGMRRRRRT
ncbi:MAG: chondroitinase-B domain-containing protein [Archangium sp.]